MPLFLNHINLGLGKFSVLRGILTSALLIASISSAHAKGTYFTAQELIDSVFQGTPPNKQTLWVSVAQKGQAEQLINYPIRQARFKYWELEGRRLWVLSEIGKEKPITFGIVTADKHIELIEVMAFREIRGDEIRLPAYTAQYDHVTLTDNGNLSEDIDGISGATYSVRTMKKVAKLALLLDSWVTGSNAGNN